jgi:hypothetical protein
LAGPLLKTLPEEYACSSKESANTAWHSDNLYKSVVRPSTADPTIEYLAESGKNAGGSAMHAWICARISHG